MGYNTAPLPVLSAPVSDVASIPAFENLPPVATYSQQAPVAVQAPVVTAVPVVGAAATEGAQYHSQDDAGQYFYGYSDPNSVKQEVRTADGVIRGAYSYVDSNGLVQTVNYIA